ncbi:MAG TPA: hypothetical protein VMZ29_00065 [Candidatus Bathyarchaeia archaeon]|nr:hypothetical protein [Candidatus Bathyarchaeia archaeon]
MKAELSKFSKIAVQNLFYSKILALGEDGTKGVLSKVYSINKTDSELQIFINGQPRSRFNIMSEDENGEYIKLVVANCPEELVRNEFEIVIDSYWTGFEVSQLSVDKQDKIIVKIHSS